MSFHSSNDDENLDFNDNKLNSAESVSSTNDNHQVVDAIPGAEFDKDQPLSKRRTCKKNLDEIEKELRSFCKDSTNPFKE
ncbi:uncharacterized protein ASCRUDRAFT_5939 [Ascoidea rubescens DSM 1968]|uniref:Uncharacterized protein n=1 Tax=Ascoidea rubescens DSM 1968 TaxID=1344418 RepID=A0A1D2VR38_9ASCO|nr:hypothetical protein ASCRUDRAFT_5939 [Ascoidea rubescens DSM 1968]ODV64059.1 hypothetical protein ASCRUDRAFT_5939 [Ascoidea rubescens DSM 1968]